MYIQGIDNLFDIEWAEGIKYRDIHYETEVEFSRYNFDDANVEMHSRLFEMYEKECLRLSKEELILPAYEYCLKCSHTFNILDARGALSVAERTTYIARVRNLARDCAAGYLRLRESMGFPLLKK